MDIKIFLPKLGESIVRATIVRWFKKIGDNIEVDEPLLEVSTDKVNSEIPSPNKGVLKEILFKENEEVNVGEAIAVISIDSEVVSIEKKCEKDVSFEKKNKETKSFLSPVAKKLVEKNSISLEEVEKIKRTGVGSRLSKKDIEEYLKKRDQKGTALRIKLTPLRKEIAKKMVLSKSIPCASLIADIDITELLKEIYKNKKAFLEKNKVKLTITSFIAKAIAKASILYPYVNSSLEGDEIILKENVNLGIAIDIKEGLLVPVIKNCEKKSILEIALGIASLAKKARENNIAIEDMKEGSITMSNFGMGGINIGIPIIKYPEAAIIGIGAITKKVLPLKNSFAIGEVITISLTFDHRIIDGMYGCAFLKEIKNYLEKFYAEESF